MERYFLRMAGRGLGSLIVIVFILASCFNPMPAVALFGLFEKSKSTQDKVGGGNENALQDVRNVVVTQVGNQVMFEYELWGDEPELEVSLAVTIDGRKHESGNLHLEGDIGKVRPGKLKKIYWAVLRDFPKGLSGDFSYEITTPVREDPIEGKIIEYYNNKGEWAGTFVIASIEKIRIVDVNDREKIAHVRYKYSPIPNNRKKRKDTGYDQRTFSLKKENGQFKVYRMGGNNSARF